ncbi:MAG: hypothetical protein E7070_06105 [Bacteroidales bacterium]|jgi:flavodoxin|nr:hypothetical protein [Bacteroidales bacterium]
MKKFSFLTALAAVALSLVSCGTKKEEPKALVLYYSQTSNTRIVAQEFATRLGADVEEIVAAQPYDGDFQGTIARCIQEREQGIKPAINQLKSDLADYDVIFLGYPIWFGTYAPPVAALLDSVDLSGKRVVPFCTFGSGGLESSVKDLAARQPKAEILDGYGVRAARLSAVPKEVGRFLQSSGFIAGDYVKPEPFGEAHDVTDEESALFDAAVANYPMIHAKAQSVASRIVADGVEHLFTAVDLPREGADTTATLNQMQVYVLVADGAAPVFTRVVR